MRITDNIRSILAQKGTRVVSISPDVSVFDAMKLMAEEDIGSLAVAKDGRLYGMISERDYARKVILLGRSSKDSKVSEVMTQPATCVSPDDSVEDCMRLMLTHRNRHVLVLERGEIAGVISIGDLVNWIISAQAHTIEQLQTYISSSYPG